MCLYQGDDGDGIYINMARGGVGLTVDGAGGGYSAIFNNGNVGIGTTSPSMKLSIGDGTGTSNQYIRMFSSATDMYIGQSASLFGLGTVQAIVTDSTYNNALGIGTLSNTACLVFATNNIPRITITGGGNVGIGTCTPTYKLEILGSSGTFSFNPNQASAMIIRGSVTGNFDINNEGASGAMRIYGTSIQLRTAAVDPALTIASTGIACFACQVCAPLGIVGRLYISSPPTGTTPLQISQNESCNGYISVTGDQRIAAGNSIMYEYVGSVPSAGNACVLVIGTQSQGSLHTRATYEIHGVSAEYNLNGATGAFGGIIAIEYLNNVNVVQGYNLYGALCSVSSSNNCIKLSLNRQYNGGLSDYEGVTVRIKLLTTGGWNNYFNSMTMQ